MVGDDPHRVNRLLRAACADHDLSSGHITVAAKRRSDATEKLWRFQQPPFANQTGRQPAGCRPGDGHATLLQQPNIGLGRGIVEHVSIHRRSHDDGSLSGKQRGGQSVVSQALGHLGYCVGGGRSDDYHVGSFGQSDVIDA